MISSHNRKFVLSFVGLLSSQNICAQVFEVADSGKMNDGLASVSGLATRWE